MLDFAFRGLLSWTFPHDWNLSMEIWTEYEGRTIDGAFPLKKLLLPEGRSAFFSTSNGKGIPTVIRLIASHFDEEEILARWRGVEALGHPNILKIEQYGQLLLDDTTVVYAVFEPVEANLAEVIAGQRLTVAEATQLGSSLASALEVLHRHGFVHEHVEPANVFAVGEVVKLRGDCIRETPEGASGQDAKRRDIHDLAVVLLQALAQAETLEVATRVRPLPAPFDEIVRNGLSGAWRLEQIMAALGANGPAASVVPASPAIRTAAAVVERKDAAKASAEPASKSDTPEPMPVKGNFAPPTARPLFVVEGGGRRSLPPAKWMAAGLAVLLVFWLIWHATHVQPANRNAATQGGSATVSSGAGQTSKGHAGTAQTGTGATAKPIEAGSSAAGKKSLSAQENAGAGVHEQWRVVAFTYNHADQAQKKAEAIAQKHADLRPEVFTPTGRAPYLVAVGGWMSREQAFTFAQRVRGLGLPRDTYAQNYSGKQR
jgi:eukaryotic-like serine/threonine-protein kinase